MSISVIYHVEVEVPNHVWEEFGYTQEYEIATLAATKGNVSAGTNYYYRDAQEWAEFSSRAEAEACERKLMDVMYHFAAKLI